MVDRDVLSSSLAERLKRWMGFRNLLVHIYLEIDHGKSYDAIREDLGDLEEFATILAPLLRS